MTTWQYYDIRTNWPKFYEIWQRPHIQECIEQCMLNYVDEYQSLKWSPGRPPWTSCLSDLGCQYHNDIIDEKTNDYIQIDKSYDKFIAAHDRAGYRLSKYDRDDIYDYFSSCGAMNEIRQKFYHTPKDLDYWLCEGAEDFLLYPTHLVMIELYPNEYFAIVEGKDYSAQQTLVMPGRKWIVDIVRAILPGHNIQKVIETWVNILKLFFTTRASEYNKMV